MVEYSRDEVHVHVVALSALRLVAPTKKIVVGGALPIYLLGQVKDFIIYIFVSVVFRKSSVSDPDPVGSVSFGRVRIRIHFRKR